MTTATNVEVGRRPAGSFVGPGGAGPAGHGASGPRGSGFPEGAGVSIRGQEPAGTGLVRHRPPRMARR
jgi:hypothetical protein